MDMDAGIPARTDGLQPWRLSFIPPRELRLPGYDYGVCEETTVPLALPSTPPRCTERLPHPATPKPMHPRAPAAAAAPARPAHEVHAGALFGRL
jgi:hypothetical protein